MEGLANPLSLITQGIKSLSDLLSYINPFNENFILKNILDWLNPFSENFILKSVIDFLGNMLSYINPLSDNFFGKKLVDLFSDLLKLLFIPSEENVNNLVNSVKDKFSFVDYIKNSVGDVNSILSGSTPAPSLTIHINETAYTKAQDIKIIDLSWYTQFKELGDKIFTGFIYAFFIWRTYTNLPNIISGAGSAINDVPAEISDISAYSKFGFGRASTTKRGKGNSRK